MRLRFAQANDLEAMRELYVQTIRSVCRQDYSAEQIDVWTQTAQNHERWHKVMQEQLVVVAEKNRDIVGYGTLRDGNYIDFFYIHKDFQRQGIARKILDQIEQQAVRLGQHRLTSEVSITARPFFERNGYVVLKKQHNLRKGVELVNFKMEKRL